jgi:hypothetical protein
MLCTKNRQSKCPNLAHSSPYSFYSLVCCSMPSYAGLALLYHEADAAVLHNEQRFLLSFAAAFLAVFLVYMVIFYMPAVAAVNTEIKSQRGMVRHRRCRLYMYSLAIRRFRLEFVSSNIDATPLMSSPFVCAVAACPRTSFALP